MDLVVFDIKVCGPNDVGTEFSETYSKSCNTDTLIANTRPISKHKHHTGESQKRQPR